MSTAQFPDGHTEEMHNARLSDIFNQARDACFRGADKVTIYHEPHRFDGTLRRCATCGHMKDDPLHDLEKLAELAAALEIVNPVLEKAGVTEEEATALLRKLQEDAEELTCPACCRPLSNAESPRLCIQCARMLQYAPDRTRNDPDCAIVWLREEWTYRKRSK